jgi:hypothetical protein
MNRLAVADEKYYLDGPENWQTGITHDQIELIPEPVNARDVFTINSHSMAPKREKAQKTVVTPDYLFPTYCIICCSNSLIGGNR